MAISVTGRGSNFDGIVTSTVVGNSFTPNTGDFILAVVGVDNQRDVSSVSQTSASSWNCIFEQIDQTAINNNTRFALWGGFVKGLTPTDDTITAALSGSARPGTLLIQVSGADVSGTVSNAIIQKIKATGYNQQTSLALGTLAALTGGNTLLTLGQNFDQSKRFTPQSNFTELQDESLGQFGLGSFYSTTNETAPKLNYSATYFAYTGGICVEIKAAAGGTTPLTGSASIAFSAAAALVGLGLLAGASSIVVTPTATLTGLGSLAGSSDITVTPTATLTGLGSLVGESFVAFAASATLSNANSTATPGPSVTIENTEFAAEVQYTETQMEILSGWT